MYKYNYTNETDRDENVWAGDTSAKEMMQEQVGLTKIYVLFNICYVNKYQWWSSCELACECLIFTLDSSMPLLTHLDSKDTK